MIHSFDSDIAKQYGLVEAILLQNFAFWIAKNEANERNYFDGRYWTYNSVKAFQELFPYITTKQLRRALDHIIAEGLIITGNYNADRYNRTLWYALTEKGKCIFPIGQMDVPEKANGFAPEGKCTNTDNKQQIINTDLYKDKWNSLPDVIPKVQSIRGTRATALKSRISEYGEEKVIDGISRISKSEFLKGKNDRGWIITFDWFVKPSNFVKVLEGNYDDKKTNKMQRKPSFDIDEIGRRAKLNDNYDV